MSPAPSRRLTLASLTPRFRPSTAIRFLMFDRNTVLLLPLTVSELGVIWRTRTLYSS